MTSARKAVVSAACLALLAGCASSGRDDASGGPAFDPALEQTVTGSSAIATPIIDEAYDPTSGVRFAVFEAASLNGWAADDHAEALSAFYVSCDRFDALSDDSRSGGLLGAVSDWRPICAEARKVRPANARGFFEENFAAVRVADPEGGLYTGYYEPVLRASRTPQGRFQFPLYRRPPEVVRYDGGYGRRLADGRVQPYYSRAEIDRGALDGRGLEIAYLDDAVDNFFLHIQGSGRLSLVDGGAIRVGYAAKNGWPYQSVGKAMLRKGWAPGGDASAGAIKAFYRDDPQRGDVLLAENPSYIFFREVDELDPAGGPVGAFGVQLVPLRSLAVDRRYAPLGAPVWVSTDSPTGPLQRLMMAHDTGSAILGAQRGDVYWGSGDAAGETAGRMKHSGTLTVLLPKPLAARLVERSQTPPPIGAGS